MKERISVKRILLLVVFAILTISSTVLLLFLISHKETRFPLPNNTDAASEIIKHLYPDAELEKIENLENFDDIAKYFEIECIRDPRGYSDQYLPYAVFLSESGKKYFIFFQPQKETGYEGGIIQLCIANERFLSNEELLEQMNELSEKGTKWSGWKSILKQFESGDSSGAKIIYFTLASQNGIFGVSLSRGDNSSYSIKETSFFPDDTLMYKPSDAKEEGWRPWLILPIDKQ